MFSSTKMYLLFLSAAFFFACGTESQAVQIDDEVAAARKYLKSIGAIFTTNDADQVIGLQFPEGISLNKQTWPYIGKLKELRALAYLRVGLPSRLSKKENRKHYFDNWLNIS